MSSMKKIPSAFKEYKIVRINIYSKTPRNIQRKEDLKRPIEDIFLKRSCEYENCQMTTALISILNF